ncbi:MAG: DNA polymerase III subunit delta [Acidiferrobacter sp.]
MRIKGTDLPARLEPLAAVYLVAGDEPFLVTETLDHIVRAATARGFGERRRLSVESGFSWHDLRAELSSPSLFAPRTIYELRAESRDGLAREVPACLPLLHPDVLLVVATTGLDRAAQQAAWVEAVAAAGMVVLISTPAGAELVRWLRARLAAAGADADLAPQIAYYTEGNLAAAWQAVERLAMMPPGLAVAVEDLTSDEARFDVFVLTDAAVRGEGAAVHRALHRLRAEGQDPILILWALSREVRLLLRAAACKDRRQSLQDIWRSERVWPARQAVLQAALGRLSQRVLARLLGDCARLDRINKGRADGDAWLEIERLALRVAGARLGDPV